MSDQKNPVVTRRLVTARLSAMGLAALVLPAASQAQQADLPLTPACGAPAKATQQQIEGPYFSPSSPIKQDFRGDGPGEVFVLSGFVLTRQCKPVQGALIDLWHADSHGAYDAKGFNFRGHQLSDAQGRYQFITRVPGLYPGRTRHFHAKLRGQSGQVLTTQLYFPGEAGNARDWIYDRALLMEITRAQGGQLGRFDFVIAL